MAKVTRLQCRCGEVEMAAEGAPIMSTECLCNSCREAADVLESLPGAPPLKEATSGTRTEMFRKDRVHCVKGGARLREFRLNEKTKTRRVVAACCNTAMFLDFTDGHWVDLYGPLWPEGSLPTLQMRTMAGDLDDLSMLPEDVPIHKTHSPRFFLTLIGAWISMGFRRPKINCVEGVLDVRT